MHYRALHITITPGLPGGKSQGSSSTQRGLHPPLPVQTQLDQISNCHEQQLPCWRLASAGEQKCSRTGSNSKISGFLQQTILGTQTQQPVETYLGPEHLEHLSKHRVIQNGDTRDNKNLTTGRGVGYLCRFQRCLLPHTNSQSVQEVHAFSCPGSVLPVQSPTLWPVNSTNGVHSGGQRGQADGLTKGYKDPLVSRRLVGESQVPPYLFPAYTDLSNFLSRAWLVNREKSELVPNSGPTIRRKIDLTSI